MNNRMANTNCMVAIFIHSIIYYKCYYHALYTQVHWPLLCFKLSRYSCCEAANTASRIVSSSHSERPAVKWKWKYIAKPLIHSLLYQLLPVLTQLPDSSLLYSSSMSTKQHEMRSKYHKYRLPNEHNGVKTTGHPSKQQRKQPKTLLDDSHMLARCRAPLQCSHLSRGSGS